MDNHLRKIRKKRHSQDFPVKKIKLLNEVSECCHLDAKNWHQVVKKRGERAVSFKQLLDDTGRSSNLEYHLTLQRQFCIWHLAPLNAVKLRWWHSAWHLRPSLGPFKSWECQGMVRETSPSSTWDTGMRRKVSDLTTSSLSWCLKLDARETSRWSMDLWNRLTSERSISLKCCPYL